MLLLPRYFAKTVARSPNEARRSLIHALDGSEEIGDHARDRQAASFADRDWGLLNYGIYKDDYPLPSAPPLSTCLSAIPALPYDGGDGEAALPRSTSRQFGPNFRASLKTAVGDPSALASRQRRRAN